jgi:hypothetical protein
MDLVITLARVLFQQAHDQGFKIRRHTRPARLSFPFEGPSNANYFSMPEKYLVWLEE